MIKTKILFIFVIVSLITGLTFWLLHLSLPSVTQSATSPLPTASPSQSFVPFTSKYQQISIKAITRDQGVMLYLQRHQADHDYDWKVSLNFFGRVVDENNVPVSGAKVYLSWTTLDDPSGTKEENILSDNNGLFSLKNQRGKLLEVRVVKNDYYSVEGDKGLLAYEYANPAENNYYEPDSTNPVIFHLRKKGSGAKLVNKTLHFVLTAPQTSNVDLMAGRVIPEGSLQVESNMPSPRKGTYPWSVKISMSSGGLIETNDQFPFQAPENGYVSASTLDMTKTDSTWGGAIAKNYYFYLPETKTYGILRVEAWSGTCQVFLTYSYNPTPGDRNLEPASK